MSTQFDSMTPEQRLRWLSDELGVDFEPQDWGIVNADAARLDEFTAFLCEHDLAPTQAFQMIELILASANELLLDDPSADLEAVDAALSRHPEAAEHHVEYWSLLHDPDEFPIAAWLRARRAS